MCSISPFIYFPFHDLSDRAKNSSEGVNVNTDSDNRKPQVSRDQKKSGLCCV